MNFIQNKKLLSSKLLYSVERSQILPNPRNGISIVSADKVIIITDNQELLINTVSLLITYVELINVNKNTCAVKKISSSGACIKSAVKL